MVSGAPEGGNPAANILYFFLRFASARSRFSATLNFTIFPTRENGMGLSSGNCTVPFPPSNAESSLLNFLTPEDAG